MWKRKVNWVVLALPAVMWLGVPHADGQVRGYVLAGPVGVTGFFGSQTTGHVGGGGEFLLGSPVAVGAEVGVMSYGGMFAVNGGVNLGRDRNRVWAPFASAGYFRWSSGEGSFDGANVAGGTDYWFRDRFGLRMEVRDHIRPDSRGTVQYWSFRFGAVFR